MYHFISGYTSKLAGTETGIVHPEITFSSFFGEPFMPHKPMVYANLLEQYLRRYKTTVFLINTGWTGGGYGVGKRMSIDATRAIVNAALDGNLDEVEYTVHPIFNLSIPVTCPHVNADVLHPMNTWKDKEAYKKQANELARRFEENIKKFEGIREDIIKAGPHQEATDK